MKPALFIDRDGTINVNCPYCKNESEIKVYDDVYKPIAYLSKYFLIIIVTNQSGIARGYFTEDDLKRMNSKIVKLIRKHGGRIDAIYYCPHLPDSGCLCRKPNTGMVEKAMSEFDIDIKNSLVIGDDGNDIKMARRLGIKSILVDRQEKNADKLGADFVAKDFNDVLKIIKRMQRSSKHR